MAQRVGGIGAAEPPLQIREVGQINVAVGVGGLAFKDAVGIARAIEAHPGGCLVVKPDRHVQIHVAGFNLCRVPRKMLDLGTARGLQGLAAAALRRLAARRVDLWAALRARASTFAGAWHRPMRCQGDRVPGSASPRDPGENVRSAHSPRNARRHPRSNATMFFLSRA